MSEFICMQHCKSASLQHASSLSVRREKIPIIHSYMGNKNSVVGNSVREKRPKLIHDRLSELPDSGEPDGREGDSPLLQIKRPKLIHFHDRLSELPDLALVHILSHLYFHEAARACVVSKRFNSVWNSVNSLKFSDELTAGKNGKKFVNFVNTALGFHRRCDLEKFYVKFRYCSNYSEAVDGWIKFAVQKRVKSLNLNLFRNNPNYKHKLPNFIYNDENLVEFVTSCCLFSNEGVINWSSLRLLSITRAKLNEELISRVLLGCPVLETLELRKWSGFDKLKIRSASLRVLRVIEEEPTKPLINPGHEYLLEISGPNLVSLEVSGRLYRRRIRLSDLGSLESAVMDFEIMDVKTLKASLCLKGDHCIATGVFNGLFHVKNFTLGRWCIEVLSVCEQYNISPPLSERKKLTLCIPVFRWECLWVATLLSSSPCLETLVIRLSCSCDAHGFKRVFKFPSDGSEEYYWKSSTTSARFPLLHLKTVKIEGLEIAKGGMQPLYQFLKFVLRNSRQLERVVIQTSKYVMPEAREEALKLLSVPKASPDAIVHFEPPHHWVDPPCM